MGTFPTHLPSTSRCDRRRQLGDHQRPENPVYTGIGTGGARPMTGNTGFNLMDEPWITVLGHDGQERQESILGLFEQAVRSTGPAGLRIALRPVDGGRAVRSSSAPRLRGDRPERATRRGRLGCTHRGIGLGARVPAAGAGTTALPLFSPDLCRREGSDLALSGRAARRHSPLRLPPLTGGCVPYRRGVHWKSHRSPMPLSAPVSRRRRVFTPRSGGPS